MRLKRVFRPRVIMRRCVNGFQKKHITNLTWYPSPIYVEGLDPQVH
jgi:hypothetical protein